ncbi:MAG: hypothetical protein R2705_22565 [Ilumatobacteraceae bacterium]
MTWTVPVKEKALSAETYTIKVEPATEGDFTAVESDTFTIEAPSTFDGRLRRRAQAPPRRSPKNNGPNGASVDVLLVQGTKAKKIAKGLPNTGSAEIQMPIKAAAGVRPRHPRRRFDQGHGICRQRRGRGDRLDRDHGVRRRRHALSWSDDHGRGRGPPPTCPSTSTSHDTATGKAVAKIAKKALPGTYELTVPVKKLEIADRRLPGPGRAVCAQEVRPCHR